MIIGKTIKYDIVSDAAYKFERGTDPCIHNLALRRFIQIVKDHAHIKSIEIYSNKNSNFISKYLDRDYTKINNILGTNFEDKSIDKILKSLGFQIEEKFQIPSWRSDIESINDLAEEVARVYGYNNIESSDINLLTNITKNINSKVNKIRNFMINNGFNEVINDPFVGDKQDQSVQIDNPLDSNRKFLRSNVINSLVYNLDFNEKRQKESIKLFEISDIYAKNNTAEPLKIFSLVASGRQGQHYSIFNKALDKNYLIELANKIGLDELYVQEYSRSLLNSKKKNKIFYIECDISNINEDLIEHQSLKKREIKFNKFKAISELPSSIRDISLSLNNENILEQLIESVFQIELEYLKDLFIFDFYNNTDKKILKIGFRFIFQSNK